MREQLTLDGDDLVLGSFTGVDVYVMWDFDGGDLASGVVVGLDETAFCLEGAAADCLLVLMFLLDFCCCWVGPVSDGDGVLTLELLKDVVGCPEDGLAGKAPFFCLAEYL